MYDPNTSQLGAINYDHPHVRDTHCIFCREVLFFHTQEGWEPEVVIRTAIFAPEGPTRFAHTRCLNRAVENFALLGGL